MEALDPEAASQFLCHLIGLNLIFWLSLDQPLWLFGCQVLIGVTWYDQSQVHA